MDPHDKEAAEAELSSILKIIGQCMDEAWQIWRGFYEPQHAILDARARAAIVFCHIVDRAKVLFVGVPNVTVGTAKGVFRLFVGDEIALRFKKANKGGLTSNISTNQQRLIDMQFRIPGILPTMMLNAVYQLDNLQRELENLMVTYQLDRKMHWSIQITPDLSGAMPIPIPVTPPAAPNKPERSKIKGTEKDKKSGTVE